MRCARNSPKSTSHWSSRAAIQLRRSKLDHREKGRTTLAVSASCRRASLMHAQYPTTFEQMIVSMRQRLRPTDAYLLADRLRICIGLNYLKTDETRLLKMLLEEVSLTWLARSPDDHEVVTQLRPVPRPI